MKTADMLNRIASIPTATLIGAWNAILQGNGGSTILAEYTITRKQVNALFAWHVMHGKTFPGANV